LDTREINADAAAFDYEERLAIILTLKNDVAATESAVRDGGGQRLPVPGLQGPEERHFP
jgi:hypothetical protein